MRILIRSFWLVALALIITSEAEENVEALSSVVESANQFSSSFSKTVANHNPGNLITSPLVVNINLAIVAFGACGSTKAQFRNVLHLPASDNLIASGYRSLIDNLNSMKHNEVGLAYKFFARAGLDIKLCFKSIAELYFRSSFQSLNFTQSQEAANIINSWAKENTKSVVTEIVTPEAQDSFTELLLVSAVYFKGQWKYGFDSKLTQDLPFHISRTEVKNVPIMYRAGNYEYGVLPEYNARFVVIPYMGDELSMIIILPNEIDGLSVVENKLQNTNFTDILSRRCERNIRLWLPKFKVESTLELNDVLKEMGLTDAFGPHANFSDITDDDIGLSDVIQKAHIEVDERGSEVAVVLYSSFKKREIDFKINRPFFYYIIKTMNDNEEDDSVIPLFRGTVSEPKI